MAWLLPVFPPVARAAAFVYYRMLYAGVAVPRRGPVLLVANHPNSLLDPMLVVAAAKRPVRFLAKAPLFTDPKTSWLVKSAGAIPVHRRADDPSQVGRNVDAFGAVHRELATGEAVGIFPEGLSHSEPSLAPLKTGAARMALGAAAQSRAPVQIVPIGLMFRAKDVFRSDALVITGPPVDWQDLATRGPDDADTVRELTERIAAGLSKVTLNLERWADWPLVECAIRVWEAEQTVRPEARDRVARLDATTRLLARVRQTHDDEGLALADDVAQYAERLARLGLRPGDLSADVSTRRAIAWARGRAYLLLPLALIGAVAGWLVFFPPYRLTGWIVGRVRLRTDETSTWKLLVGIGTYTVWVAMVSAAAAILAGRAGGGWWWVAGALAALVGLPAIGMLGLLVRERWRGAWQDARRFFLLRTRRDLIAQLREDRHSLGQRLDAILRRLG